MGNAANAGFEILNEKNRVWAVNPDEGKKLKREHIIEHFIGELRQAGAGKLSSGK